MRLAFTEAAGHLNRARLALARAGVVLPRHVQVDLLVAEAEALARAGEPELARELLVRARGHAEACGDPARIGAVAFGLQRLGARFAMRRYDLIEPLDAARQAVAGATSRSRPSSPPPWPESSSTRSRTTGPGPAP